MDAAKARWELENQVQDDGDALYKYDEAAQNAINQQRPWKNVSSDLAFV